jgi:hypothetical protein
MMRVALEVEWSSKRMTGYEESKLLVLDLEYLSKKFQSAQKHVDTRTGAPLASQNHAEPEYPTFLHRRSVESRSANQMQATN